MLDFFRKKSLGRLGIDISSSSVKLLELSKQGDVYKVESYARKSIPESVVVEKNINDLEALGEVIYKLSSSVKTKVKDAAVAVSGSSVITKVIELSASYSDSDMENQILVEADQYIPYPLDEVAIDFERQRISPKNPDMVEVLLAACKKDNVDQRIAALEVGGYKVKEVDIEAYAVERGYELLKEQMELPDNDLVAIIDIGSTMTTLYILREGSFIYTREQIFGGAQLTSKVQDCYDMNFEEAEAAIMEGGLPEDFEAEVLLPYKEDIVEQIGRSLQFFFSSSQYNAVELIILAGGAAATEGLAELVEGNLSCKTVVANPFAKMKVGSKVNKAQLSNDASSLLVASGLAMRGFLDD